jgi:hypothetical protein
MAYNYPWILLTGIGFTNKNALARKGWCNNEYIGCFKFPEGTNERVKQVLEYA